MITNSPCAGSADGSGSMARSIALSDVPVDSAGNVFGADDSGITKGRAPFEFLS